MSAAVQQRLKARYEDLMSRAKVMRSMGYHGSADALLRQAWVCAEQRLAIPVETFVNSERNLASRGDKHA